MATVKGTRPSTRKRNKLVANNLSPKSELARNRALRVVSLMRTEGKPLAVAMREAETTKRTVDRYVASALIKEPSGLYRAKAFDRLARHLNFLTPDGPIALSIRGSRTASKVAEYSAAVDHYLKTGDSIRLDEFRGKSVRAGKQVFPFITDPRVLARLANAGQVAFEDLYAISS
jgi:hypothetical protein